MSHPKPDVAKKTVRGTTGLASIGTAVPALGIAQRLSALNSVWERKALWSNLGGIDVAKIARFPTIPSDGWMPGLSAYRSALGALYKPAIALPNVASLTSLLGWTGKFDKLFDDFGWMTIESRRVHMIADAGWAPHHLLPRDQLAPDDATPEQVRENIAAYVAAESEAIADALLEKLPRYVAVPRAAELQRQAMVAMQAGAPLVVPPAVFPEIERCARAFMGQPSMPSTKVVREMLSAFMELPVSKIRGFSGVGLVDVLETRVYSHFKFGDDTGGISGFLNRHGSIHGVVEYNDNRDAWNALFLLDFVLDATVELLPLAVAS